MDGIPDVDMRPRPPSPDVDFRGLALGQLAVAVVVLITWVTTGLDETTGTSFDEFLSVVAIAGSLPAFVTGMVAGLFAPSRPQVRRGILIGFALLVSLAVVALYLNGPHPCQTSEQGFAASCSESWKDAVGGFLGAEFAIAFQAVVAWLFAGIARKYPLRRPAA